MSDDGNIEDQLPWSGERYVPQIAGNIRLEHVHRYLLAREWCRGRCVLDIACGEGYGSAMLAQVADRVTGVDNVADVVAHARRQYHRPNLDFTAGDCGAIPLLDASVDIVVSFETIEHHNRHDTMLREIKRVLKPGGMLIISSPDKKEYSDVPAYTNPFHVRELYRNEFEDLLGTHFGHVSIAGQRIKAGSLIWPLGDAAPAAFDGFEASEGDGVRPIGAPLYLIAVASDEPVAPIPAGLFDGGAFVWSRDHVEAFQSVDAHYQGHFRQLTDERAQAEARTAATQAVLEAHHSRMSTLEAEVARFAHDIDALSAEKTELQQAAREADQRLANASRDHSETLTALSLEHSERLAALSREHEQRMAEVSREHGRLVDQVRLMEGSHSWRLTAPLRAMRRAIQRRQPPFRMLQQAALGAYRALPLSVAARLRIRSGLFRAFPFLFQRTSAYRAWDAYRRTTERLQAPASPHAPATTTALVLPDWFYSDAENDYVPIAESAIVETRIKAVAFYLPQFHPIPENDRWWGKGFTEWTNVSRGKPQFAGHYQPHLPGELGFYDLRNPDVQRRQIELAKMYGLHGFCYHHYWFGGTRLLRQPLDQMLASPDMDFPFCLCWANENWTRRWDGNEAEVLIAQSHSPEDDLAFIKDIEPALRDRRYIRIDDRPLLIVYRPRLLPDARATAERWRTYCREAGLGDPFLVATHAFDRSDPCELGFDAAMEFAPNNMGAAVMTDHVALANPDFQGIVYDYRYLVEYSRQFRPPSYLLFRSVTPMWDNEARRSGRGAVFANASPALYKEALELACRYTEEHVDVDKPFVFINAWNEWAEGAHLEPDRRYGYAYLQATAEALRRSPARREAPIVCVSHDAHFHGAQLLTLNIARTLSQTLGREVEILLCGDGALRSEFERVGRVHDFSVSATGPEARAEIVRALYARGARSALCNTSAVGHAVECLSDGGFTVVSMVHELPGLIARHQLEGSARQIAARADRIVFAADVVRDRFTELTGLSPDKAIVRPQGLYVANRFKGRRDQARRDLRVMFALDDHTRILLGAGFADYRKGIDLFVEVGLALADRCPEVRLIWIGQHEADTFARAYMRIKESGLESVFLFPGAVREPDLFFAGADLYLMTSREDPFPAVVLEALDVEVPVVGFEGGGGFAELLRRGCGVLVPFLDTGAMAQAALRLLNGPAERSQLAATGRRIIDQEFDFVTYVRFLVDLVTPRRLTLSAVVPNYNYARYLPQRLNSIFNQTTPPDEIIFLDDASTDDSVQIAQQILSGSAIPYRIIRNETNQGCYSQWLRGIGEATGDLVWLAEADDDCRPTLLEALTATFDRDEVVLAFCQSKQIDGEGLEIAPHYLAWTDDVDADKWRHPYVRRGIDEIRDSLIIKNTIPNVSAVVMRRPDLSAIAGTLVGLRNAGDWMVYLHLLERGDIAFVPDALNLHRRHGRSVTIGKGGLNLMREILFVQRRALEKHAVVATVEAKRQACLQTTYEYLGLNVDGPVAYSDHEALKEVLPAAAR